MSRIQVPSAGNRPRHVRLERALLVAGVLALGYNLRGAITSLPPVFPELAGAIGLSSAAISVLAATPVVCFGVVSGFAAGLARRAGEERVLLGAIIALTVGLVARGVAPAALLFPGTIVSGAAIAVMNVLLVSLIKRRWPERAGFLIGLYVTALSAGAIVGSLVSVPLWNGTGGSVSLTLGWVAVPAALGVLVWLPQLSSGATPRTPQLSSGGATPRTPQLSPGGATPRTPRSPVLRTRWYKPLVYRARKTGRQSSGEETPCTLSGPRETDGEPREGAGSVLPVPAATGAGERSARPVRVPVHRHAVAWYVTIFMGTQSLLYYSVLSWLPTMLRDRGESAAGAGELLALMGVGNLAVSLFVPVVAQRMRSQAALVVPTVASIAGGLAALMYAPLGGAVAWALILGAGQNAALALAIFFTTARAPDAAAAASLASLAQSVGYLLASTGPLEVGLLHSATGSWTVPVMLLFALSVVLLVAGILAARPGVLPTATRARTLTAEITARKNLP